MKSAIFTGIALALASVGLAGCQQGSQDTAAESGEAAPEAPEGIEISKGRLVLPPVSGNPGAVYFEVINNGEADTAIAGVSVDGAGHSMLHTTVQSDGMSKMQHLESVPVPKGATVSFAPGGNHVMAMDLSDDLKPGTSTDVTLTFSSGDKASFTADVRAAGDAD